MSGRSIASIVAICIAFTIASLAIAYHWRITTSCKGRAEHERKCERPDPDIVNDLFFATQTVTTTGYGGGVNVLERDVQIIASIGTVVGSIFWALFAAGLFTHLARSKDQRDSENDAKAKSQQEKVRRKAEKAERLAEKQAQRTLKKEQERALRAARHEAERVRLDRDALEKSKVDPPSGKT